MRKRILSNEHGSALIYTVIVAMIFTIMTYIINERAKQNAIRSAKLDAEKELEKMEQTIVANISSPVHCTAAFIGLPRSTGTTSSPNWRTIPSANGFRECTSGFNCTHSSYSYTLLYPIQTAGSAWTYSSSPNSIKRVRIVSMRYNQNTPQNPGWGNTGTPAAYTLEVTYEINKSAYISSTNPIIGKEVRTYPFKVITFSWNSSIGWQQEANIYGCPKSPDSTTPY